MFNNNLEVQPEEVRASALLNFLLLNLAMGLFMVGLDLVLFLVLIYITLSFARVAWFKPLLLNRIVVRKVKKLFSKGEAESLLPVRFSAKIGFILSFFALLTSSLGYTPLVFISLCLLASALNAFTGICIACKLYPRYMLLKHKLGVEV